MKRKFLGFTVRRSGAERKERVRQLTRRKRGANFAAVVAALRESLSGWQA